ncbi:MAG TPA: thioredoxin [Nanoarchaeota archaeon]|nr:thioredoxin [Nanoarchaeota archaeon]
MALEFLKKTGLASLALAVSVSAVSGDVGGNHVEELTPKTFDGQVLQNEKPAAVMFYADGCPYCRQMTPRFERICAELKAQIYCAAYNTDHEHDTASQTYGIDGVPQFGFFNGGETDRSAWIEGAVPENVLRSRMRSFIADASEE